MFLSKALSGLLRALFPSFSRLCLFDSHRQDLDKEVRWVTTPLRPFLSPHPNPARKYQRALIVEIQLGNIGLNINRLNPRRQFHTFGDRIDHLAEDLGALLFKDG